MKLAKIFLLILLVPGASVACINSGQGTAIDGGSGMSHTHVTERLEKARTETADQRFFEIQARPPSKEDEAFANEELQGVRHVLNGRYQQALAIFQAIEKDHPGHYNTAANLGTTYELLGDLEQASKWIAEGIRRNPRSHDGTEWLHVAILDARIKLKEDPGYLTHTHIIPVPEGITWRSSMEVQGKELPVQRVIHALEYQLHERVFFVRTPDPVVADLLFSLGQLTARINTLESAVEVLAMARAYGYPDSAGLEATIREYKSTILFRKIRVGALIAAGVLLGVFFLIYAYKKKWFFLSSQDYRKHLEMKKLQEGISPSGAA
jgi:tetratricopeptide (TPR) repeat protein